MKGLLRPADPQALQPEVKCGICKRLLHDPVNAGCSHTFCRTCLDRRLAGRRSDPVVFCPVCSQKLGEVGDATYTVKNKLTLVEVRCSAGCGQVLRLSRLDPHLADDCPNGCVICKYAKNGCPAKVQRKSHAEHEGGCEWRPDQCEYCGKDVLHREIPVHRRKTGCLDRYLKTKVAQGRRGAHMSVKEKSSELRAAASALEQHERRRLRQHRILLERPDSGRAVRRQCRHFLYSNAANLESCILTAKQAKTPTSEVPGTVSLTPTRLADTPGADEKVAYHCARCDKIVVAAYNGERSCCWHEGPIIPLFGGMCQACGRQNHTRGCATGSHVPP